MALFQLFAFINITYLLLIGSIFIVAYITSSFIFLKLSFLTVILVIIFLISLFLLNFIAWQKRYYLLLVFYRGDISSFAKLLQEDYKKGKIRSGDSLTLLLEVSFISSQLDTLEDLLKKEKGKHSQRSFILESTSYFVLKGQFKEAFDWLNTYPLGKDQFLFWYKDILEAISYPKAKNFKEVFLHWDESLFSHSSGRRLRGFKFLRLLNAYFYHLFLTKEEETLSLDLDKKILGYSLGELEKSYNSLNRYPLFYLALSPFWEKTKDFFLILTLKK